MSTILHIIRKEFIQLRRDPRMLPVLLFPPVIQLIIFGYAANLDVRDIPVVVCDLDRTAASRDFVSQFVNSGYFALEGAVGKADTIDSWIERRKASMAVVIPRGFGTELAGSRPTQIQLIVDGSESQAAIIGLNYASMVVMRYSQNILLERFERFPSGTRPAQVNPEVRVWYNPDLKSRNFMVPGVLGLLLMVMTTVLTSLAIVKEKEVGTLEQLIVTPIRPYQLILGKLLPFLLIGLIDIFLVVVVARYWFFVPMEGSVPLFFGLGLIFMMTTLGLGLFISTVSKNQQQAMMTSVFFILPMIILSGFFFPIENMPKIIQAFTAIIPLRYFLVIVRGIFLKGAGVETLWDETAALLIFGISILTLSILRFRKKLE